MLDTEVKHRYVENTLKYYVRIDIGDWWFVYCHSDGVSPVYWNKEVEAKKMAKKIQKQANSYVCSL